MSKPFIFGLVLGAALLAMVGVGASRLQQQEDSAKKRYQAELVDATPVKPGVLTEQQRAHRKLYSRYRPLIQKSIGDLAADANDKIVRIRVFVGLGEELTDSETPEEYFGDLIHKSDAVIRGIVIKQVSQITEDDAFLFTEYDVVVKEILKNNTLSPLDDSSTITVVHPGGKVLLENGVIVKAVNDAFAPFVINNRDVVLFLRFIPETAAYCPTGNTASFEVNGSIVKALTEVQVPPGILHDTDSFLHTLRAVAKK